MSLFYLGAALLTASALSPPVSVAVELLRTHAGTAVSALEQSQAEAFWTTFRATVAREDWAAVANMTATPLWVRGEVDQVPPQKVVGKNLPMILSRLMTQSVYLGKGKPMRPLAAWVRETERLSASHWVANDQIRFYALEFRKIKDSWKLTAMYSEDL